MNRKQRIFQHRFAGPMLAVGVPALLYWATLYPGPGGRFNPGDSLKYQFIGEALGVPHAPGNPQYVVLNFLWTRLPLPGALADRVNLLSMVLSLVALGLVYTVALRLSGNRRAAVLGTWTMAFARFYWMFSTEAEVYTLNLAWVAALLLTACEWRSSRDDRWLLAMIVVYALSFGNHATMITFLPALVFLVLATDAGVLLRPKWIAAGLAAIAAGISQYGFVYWRSQHPEGSYVEGIVGHASISDLVDTMLARAHRGEFDLRAGWDYILHRHVGEVLGALAADLLYPALALAAIGGWLLWRRDRVLSGFLGLSALGAVAIAALSEAGDWQSYVLPILPVVALAASVAVAASLRDRPPLRSPAVWVIVLPLAVIVPLNYSTLYVAESPFDVSDLLEVAESPAIIIVGEPENTPQTGYLGNQLRHYFTHSLDADGISGVRVRSVEALRDGSLLLSDEPLYFTDYQVREALWIWQTDIVERSRGSDFDDWVQSLPAGSQVAVMVTSLSPAGVRDQLARSLRTVGLGAALLENRDLGYYVGFGMKGASTGGVEVTHRSEAVLEIDPEDDAAAGLGVREPISLYAARTARSLVRDKEVRYGERIALTVDGRVDWSENSGLHAFALGPEEAAYRTFYVDSRAGLMEEPRYLVTATEDPVAVARLTAEPGERPKLLRTTAAGSKPLNFGSMPIELVVVSRSELRVKGSYRYAADGRRDGVAGLLDIARRTRNGDWVFLVLDAPLSAAAQPIVDEALDELGLPVPAWEEADGYVVTVGQARVAGSSMTVGPADGDAVFRLFSGAVTR